jgi:hypothetical protein
MLSVPLTKTQDAQRCADLFPSAPNLEGATLTVRVYAPGATDGFSSIYASDTAFATGMRLTVELLSLRQSGRTSAFGSPSLNPFDAAHVKQLNLEVQGGSGPSGSTRRIVYIDGIRASNLAVNDTFDSSSGNFAISSQVAPGAKFAWAKSVP